jgi:phosphoribosyl 1,2-cyclic phosphodiesterase
MDKLCFQCFGTGSSGNCYYIGNGRYGILIDAGIPIRNIKRNLSNIGVDLSAIRAVFVTHDHIDHIKAVGVLGEKYHVPVFTTGKIHEGIQRNYGVTQKLFGSKRQIEVNSTVEIEDIKITSFPVSHDASECVGYTVEYKSKAFSIATDLGYISSEAAEHLRKADYVVIEANYDEEMLRKGPYPVYLQERIRANTGHLSNEQAGLFLAENYNERLKNIFLCHLSKENNTPATAYTTVKQHLEQKQIIVGQDVELIPLERLNPSKLYVF